MPDGIYLDTDGIKPDKMAEKMIEIINNTNKYYDFFRWHDHYSFHFSGENRYREEICRLCAFLNNSKNQTSVYENIAEWWNEPQPAFPSPPPYIYRSDKPNNVEKFIGNMLDFLGS